MLPLSIPNGTSIQVVSSCGHPSATKVAFITWILRNHLKLVVEALLTISRSKPVANKLLYKRGLWPLALAVFEGTGVLMGATNQVSDVLATFGDKPADKGGRHNERD